MAMAMAIAMAMVMAKTTLKLIFEYSKEDSKTIKECLPLTEIKNDYGFNS